MRHLLIGLRNEKRGPKFVGHNYEENTRRAREKSKLGVFEL